VPIGTPEGAARFHIDNPRAKSSPAARDDAAAPSSAGYTLFSRVIIEPGAADVAPALAAAGVVPAPLEGAPGFLVAECDSIADAIALANSLRARPGVKGAYIDARAPFVPRTLPTDPSFGQQWHLHNTSEPLHDVNAEPAWDAGYTGAGVTIGIVDQGWQIAHPDLAAAYSAAASQTGGTSDNHATGCAGIAGERANNGLGGASIAYDCMLSKLYYGAASVNAAAFGFRNDLNAVKSNSWGPADNGIISYMTSAERAALVSAATTGRAGLGTIFVWAGGNGASASDRVDYDPYASSRYVVPVGAIYLDDRRSTYSEPGSALLTVAQSDRDFSGTDTGIFTTSGPSGYTSAFGGTSAACPLGAGVVALMLQANPALTLRDVQHILVRSARRNDPTSSTWSQNGAGLSVSYDYGFGAIDAGAASAMAATWNPVGPELALASGTLGVGQTIPDASPAGIVRTFVVPDETVVEHVEVVLNVTHANIGDLRITLGSPSETQSVLATLRTDGTDNYAGYIFTTRRHWGESAAGEWSLTIADERAGNSGTWVSWSLTVYGGAPPCAADYNMDRVFNSQDFFDFVTDFFTGDADFNRNGTTDSQDFLDFLTAFFTGC
jgi:kexin